MFQSSLMHGTDMKMAEEIFREDQNPCFTFNCFSFFENRVFYGIMCKDMVQADGPQMTVQYDACSLRAG